VCASAETWIADSEHVLLLFEPGRHPVAYFPETDVSPHTLERTDHTPEHPDLGLKSWYSVRAAPIAAAETIIAATLKRTCRVIA
jgi:uncharacterized protein (DUF427 family)